MPIKASIYTSSISVPSAMAKQHIDVSLVEPYESESVIRLSGPFGSDQPQNSGSSVKQEFTFIFKIGLNSFSGPRHWQYKFLFPSHMDSSSFCGFIDVSPKEEVLSIAQKDPQGRIRPDLYEMNFKPNETMVDLRLRSCEVSDVTSVDSPYTRWKLGTISLKNVLRGGPSKNKWDIEVNSIPMVLRFELRYSTDVSKRFAHYVYKSSEQDASVAPKSSLLEDAGRTGDLNLVCEVSQIKFRYESLCLLSSQRPEEITTIRSQRTNTSC